uniref:cGMP-dependent protein kinase 2-like isoform X2 n=1 Tax=Myxine glutinosa TaxID=7769 RepID=UPI00358EC119
MSHRELANRLMEMTVRLEGEQIRNSKLETRVRELEWRLKENEEEIMKLKKAQEPQAQRDPPMNRTRGKAILPEPLSEPGATTATKIAKSPSTVDLVTRAIHRHDFLQGLDPDQAARVIECMTLSERRRGETVISEGEPGNDMFIVVDGELQVTKIGMPVRRLERGTLFGELAILYDCKRTATVQAITDVRLLCLSRSTFRTIRTLESQKRRELMISFLKSAKTLHLLSDAQLSHVFDCMEEKYFSDKESIVMEGEEGNTFYVIFRGRVQVTQKVEGAEKDIRMLQPGDHFGELALIRNIRRTATCTAVGNVTCLILDGEIFSETIPLDHIELPESVDGFAQTILVERESSVHEAQAEPEVTRLQLSDFTAVCFNDGEPVTLGIGAFARVELVTNGKRNYAMKKISKKSIMKMQQKRHIQSERKILEEVSCSFIIKLYAVFKDSTHIYFLLEFCEGGELWSKLREIGRFDNMTAVFCCGCVLEALTYLHGHLIVYRDLKPENLLLDHRGYVKLGDFGFACHLLRGEHTYSFCGTPEYLAPEVLKHEGHDFSVDFWAMGILIFELLTGLFRPGHRLGNRKNGIMDIKRNTWFRDIDWSKLKQGQLVAPTLRFVRRGAPYANFQRLLGDRADGEEESAALDDHL